MYRLTRLVLPGICSLILGCGTQAPPVTRPIPSSSIAPSSTSPASTPVLDGTPEVQNDPNAAQALDQHATELKRDRDGFITEVSFRGVVIGDDDLRLLSGLPRLRSLLLNDTPITDEGLVHVGQIATLQNLDVRGCPLSNAGMSHLTSLRELRALRLSGQSGATTVDDAGLAPIGQLTSLKALLLDHLWISEVGLAELQGLKKLEELYLAQTLVGDEAVATLANQFPALKKLRISRTQVTGDGLAPLSQLTQLEDLDLSENSQVTDAGLAALSRLTSLTRLNLWRVPISDAGASHLSGLTNMQWLNLDNTLIGDAALTDLKDMYQLTFLHLGSTGVTDAGLPALERLDVPQGPQAHPHRGDGRRSRPDADEAA